MAGEVQDNVWPLPAFYFKVEIDDLGEIACKEVSGLNAEAQTIEYRHGNNPEFSTIKMPGLKKNNDVELKKGVFVHDNKFFKWFSEIKLNTIKRRGVTISLLDESGKATMVWKLKNAWPSKVTGVTLKSDGNEAAVEGITLVHEGITVENA
ncbi:MAG: phage tail protein [Paludibacteraceae bacterium]|nr:phage tail protein [Paludibacteraceae bacterium]MBR4841203.1 phage tail protein [Paludibacteraceae bacterium]